MLNSNVSITEVLEVHDMDVLAALHRVLCERMMMLFPEFLGRRIIKRQVKRTIIPDILSLSSSIVNKIAHRDVENIFLERELPAQSQASSTSPQTEEFQNLLTLVFKLSDRVSALEKEAKRRDATCRSLQEELAALKETSAPLQRQQLEGEGATSQDEGRTNPPAAAPGPNDSQDRGSADDSGVVHWISDANAPASPDEEPESPPTPPTGATIGSGSNGVSLSAAVRIPADLPTPSDPQPASSHTAQIEPTADIYVGNVDRKFSSADVKRQMTRLGVRSEVTCTLLTKETHWCRAFKVTLPENQAHLVLNSNRLLPGLKVRRFSPEAPRRNARPKERNSPAVISAAQQPPCRSNQDTTRSDRPFRGWGTQSGRASSSATRGERPPPAWTSRPHPEPPYDRRATRPSYYERDCEWDYTHRAPRRLDAREWPYLERDEPRQYSNWYF
jgi:hypothetical protein